MKESAYHVYRILDLLLLKKRIRPTELARRLNMNQSTTQTLLDGKTQCACPIGLYRIVPLTLSSIRSSSGCIMAFIKSIYKKIILIINRLKELNANIYVLRIDEIQVNKSGETELIVSFTGKFNRMVMRPADLMNNDDTLRCFSPSDIKNIVQQAMYEERKHDYEIVSHIFTDDVDNNYFIIKNLKTSEILKVETITLYENQDLLSHFRLQDILSISHAYHFIENEKTALAMKNAINIEQKDKFQVIEFKK